MPAGLAVVVLGLALVSVVTVVVHTWRHPSVELGRVEGQVGALRREIAGYRAAQENATSSLDRRLLGLEQTTARAANEVRMVSDQVLARIPRERLGESEARR